MRITIEAEVSAPIDVVWQAWTTPADIEQWNAASPDWHCPRATLDLRPGGAFVYRMESRAGDAGFDFEGTFTSVEPPRRLAYTLGDERTVDVAFLETGTTVTIRQQFEADESHSAELQRQGWQAILDNFARHVGTRRA